MNKRIELIAGLNDKMDDIAELCDLAPPIDIPPRSIRLNCHNAPNMRLRGWTVWDWEGRRTADGRWSRLALHALAGGGWVAESTWCSENDGEADQARADVVHIVRDVMDIWEWTTYAKAAAKALRWDVMVRLGGED